MNQLQQNETSQKSKASIFLNFHDTGVHEASKKSDGSIFYGECHTDVIVTVTLLSLGKAVMLG